MTSDCGSNLAPSARLAVAFALFGTAYKRWIVSQTGDEGISFSRMRLLGVLHAKGPQIMCALSEELDVTARNVTKLVDALEREGLVSRANHPTDRRATVVHLTPRGEAFAYQASGPVLVAIGELFTDLNKDEQELLLQVMGKLHQGLIARGVAS